MKILTKETANTKSEIAAFLYAHKEDDFNAFISLAEEMLNKYIISQLTFNERVSRMSQSQQIDFLSKIGYSKSFNKDNIIGIKSGITYYQDDLGTIFCDALDQSEMVGGGNEEPRNEIENPIRLERIKEILSGKEDALVLDYGCGHGIFVRYLLENGIVAEGYDKFNPFFYKEDLKNYFDIVTMVEVIEHLAQPFEELDDIYIALKPNGILYVETSFSDWLTIDDAYIEPKVGHSTIWSHAGLTAMMISKGFKEGNHINRNCRIYIK